MIDIVPAPDVALSSQFPTNADRVAGVFNAKAAAWADSSRAMAADMDDAAKSAVTNAIAAHERAEEAEQTRLAAVQQTTDIKNQAIAARDAAAGSALTAQGLAHFKGKWQELSGAESVPASVWHAGTYWGLLSDVQDIAAVEPGISSVWAAVGVQVHRLTYDDRTSLRSLPASGGDMAVVDGLGLFVFEAGSDEPDDDESCFVTAEGAWLLQAVHWDVVHAWQLPDNEVRDGEFASKVLTGSATCAITSVATVASASFTGTVTGAAVGDRVIATPPGALGATDADSGRLSYHAWVSAANTVTIRLANASGSSANTNAAVRAAWPITVIKGVQP